MSNKTYTNPWAGLSSYQDPESADVQLKFCGRDNESFDVAQLIDDNIFVTLYGKSGTGKTSLLNAGVFPRLRQEQYLPVSIRLGMDAYNISFQQCILTKIAQALQGKGTQTTINVVPMPDDEQATEYLWSYFARTRFIATDGSTLFPVLVFDQFEEVFRNRRAEAETLLRHIHFMMDENHALSDRIINGNPYQYDFNFRFVASIREDDLYRLEDSIDNCYLPELKRCRYRLRSLSEQGARDVILIPGEGLFKAEEQKDIVEKIISKSRNEDGSISTNIISLLCSRIFTYHSSLSTSEAFISPTLVDSFLKGNPFEQFYNEATRGFSNREKSYIEEHLVDSTGRRNSVPESDFLLHVKNGAILLDGERKILQRTSTSSDGGNYRVELIHDSFCEPLEGQRQKRQQRRRLRLFTISLLSATCFFILVWFYLSQLQNANKQMKVDLERIVAEKVIALTDEGDSYTARRLAVQLFPKDSASGTYLPEAEAALRYASTHSSAIIQDFNGKDGYYSVCFSPHEKYLLSASWDMSTSMEGDNTIKLWEASSGRCVKTYRGHTKRVWEAKFSTDGKRIISRSEDNTIKVWDVATGNIIYSFDKGQKFYFSPNKRHLMLQINRKLFMYNPNTFKCIKALDMPNFSNSRIIGWAPDNQCILALKGEGWRQLCKINIYTGEIKVLSKEQKDIYYASEKPAPNGKLIAVALHYENEDKMLIKLLDVKTGKCLHILDGHEDNINDISFSPDSKLLVSTSWRTIRIWDVESGACLDIMKGHRYGIFSPQFSADGKRLITSSLDNMIRIWDVQEKEDGMNIPNTEGGLYLSYHPNGKELLITFNDGFSKVSDNVCLYDTQTRKKIKTIFKMDTTPKKDTIIEALFSPQGKMIVRRLNSNNIEIWNKKTNILKELKGHHAPILSVSFSKDGKLILSTSADSTLRIWNTANSQCVHIIKWPTKARWADFINNEDRILIEGIDSTFTVWDTKKGKSIKSWKAINSAFLTKISPNRKYVLTSDDNTINIFEIETGKCVKTLHGHSSFVYAFDFSPDGKYVVSTSQDTMVKVWDWVAEKCVFSETHDVMTSVQFSPDGKHIAMTGWNFSRIIDFPSIWQLVKENRERFKDRPLTKEERRKYYLD